MASKRLSPVDVHQDKHERMLDEMHSALYSLGNRIRKPMESNGDKLLPKRLRPAEPNGAKAARKHIQNLHRAMRGEK